MLKVIFSPVKFRKTQPHKDMTHFKWLLIIIALTISASCNSMQEKQESEKSSKTGNFKEERFILKNNNGLEVSIIRYGASITHIYFPDRDGRVDDIVLGFDNPDEYMETKNPFFGCVVGRYANRIANARYILKNDTVQLTRKNSHSVHGGIQGFDKKKWNVKSYSDSTLVLYYLSIDGEEGFPGNLQTWITYSVTSNNELKIDYLATTDKPTPVNLTNHTYFNLSGKAGSTILNHEVYINADHYTEVDESLLPTGNIREVKGSVMDFTTTKRIGDDLFKLKNGFDHNWVLNKFGGRLSLAAVAYDPLSGRGVEVRTTQPGIQFYTGNFLSDSLVGKNGVRYQKHAGFCLETQHFPDSPNHLNFPSTILYPNDLYYETTLYTFFSK